jgi:hypothetical protein
MARAGHVRGAGGVLRAVDALLLTRVAAGDPRPVRAVEPPQVVQVALAAHRVDPGPAEEPEARRVTRPGQGAEPAPGDVRRRGEVLRAVDAFLVARVRAGDPGPVRAVEFPQVVQVAVGAGRIEAAPAEKPEVA